MLEQSTLQAEIEQARKDLAATEKKYAKLISKVDFCKSVFQEYEKIDKKLTKPTLKNINFYNEQLDQLKTFDVNDATEVGHKEYYDLLAAIKLIDQNTYKLNYILEEILFFFTKNKSVISDKKILKKIKTELSEFKDLRLNILKDLQLFLQLEKENQEFILESGKNSDRTLINRIEASLNKIEVSSEKELLNDLDIIEYDRDHYRKINQ